MTHHQPSVDRLFEDPSRTGPFTFDADVAMVFDNMIERSVPCYHQIQHLMPHLIRCAAPHANRFLDLGCSTGSTLCQLASIFPTITGIGWDTSPELVQRAIQKAQHEGVSTRLTFEQADMTQIPLPNADVIIACLALQFIPPAQRLAVLHAMHHVLPSNGLVIVVEKTIPYHETNQAIFESIYHQVKEENGYSKVEIATKKKALDGVLIPLTGQQNEALFETAGFKSERFLTWMVFSGWLLHKQ